MGGSMAAALEDPEVTPKNFQSNFHYRQNNQQTVSRNCFCDFSGRSVRASKYP
jgi:hypothetical protein